MYALQVFFANGDYGIVRWATDADHPQVARTLARWVEAGRITLEQEADAWQMILWGEIHDGQSRNARQLEPARV